MNQLNEAISHLREAVRFRPGYSEAWNNLGNLLIKQNKLDEAGDCFRKALEINPSYARAMSNLGVVLTEQGRLDDAVAMLEQLVRLDPAFAEGHNNLGVARMKQGQLSDALADLETAIRISPAYPEPYKNQAIVWLCQGDYGRGWPAFESRWKSKDYPKYSFDASRWDGSPLGGKTILLHAEQGLGDALQFVRYAPLVKQQGAQVVLQTPKPIVPLLERCEGIDQLVALGDQLPKFDCYASLMSLPALLRTTIDSVPNDVPYVRIAPELVERWRDNLSLVHGFRIGIAWQGNREYRGDHLRSFPLRYFAPLAQVPGVKLLSLQRGPGAEQASNPDLGFSLQQFGDDFDRTPFLDTAAVMQNVDLVITSDTAVAHLAGGLGVSVWVALGLSPDWRWMLGRSDSPWYPTMKLFRQPAVGRWDDVFAEMAAELSVLIAQPSKGKA